MTRFLQATVYGLLQGGLLALVAAGFSLVWGVMNIINLAYGAFVIIGAYLAWELNSAAGLDPFLGMFVSAAALFVAGYLVQRLLINLIVNAPVFITLLLTFGLQLLLVNGLILIFSADYRSIPTSYASRSFTLAEVRVPYGRLCAFLLAVIVSVALVALMTRTRTGLQVVFFGLGGYATAALMAKSGLSFWLALPISGLLAGLFAVLIGMPLLRLKGHYFAIATLGVAEGMREVVTNTASLTGGGAGISVPIVGLRAPTPYPGNDGFYLIFLALAVAAVAVVALLSRSRFGYALRAINQDEDAAGAAGINTPRAKVAAFGLSGLMTGLVGAAYAFQQVTIFPQRLFDIEITVLIIVMVVIGGSGTVLGPMVGAVGLQ